MSTASLVVIPARLSSTRLARKMLLTETGRPLVEHTWRNAVAARGVAAVVVATDSDEIAAAVRGFGGEVVMTHRRRPAVRPGSSRLSGGCRPVT
jgi:3-deoxy-manno-octulosonate cytidylyltransferase (CMP-KDO synthetase)